MAEESTVPKREFYRRSIFLLDRKFQFRFSIFVCSWLVAVCFIYPVIVANLFDFFLNQVSNQPLIAAAVKTVRQDLLSLVILLQATYLVLTFLMSLFISHRMAGPIYKVKLILNRFKSGETRERVTLRANDHFLDLADEVNALLDHATQHNERSVSELTQTIEKLELTHERFKRMGDSPSKNDIEAVRAEIISTLASLRETREHIPH